VQAQQQQQQQQQAAEKSWQRKWSSSEKTNTNWAGTLAKLMKEQVMMSIKVTLCQPLSSYDLVAKHYP